MFVVSAKKENIVISFFIDVKEIREALEVANKEVADIFGVEDVNNIDINISQMKDS
jgi:hypothetical protein